MSTEHSDSTEEVLKKQIVSLEAEVRRLNKNKLYGLVWEDKTEEVVSLCKENIPLLVELKSKQIATSDAEPDNILIEGDNYHALCVLNFTHKKNIDLIYIDPPYNTGAKNWKYNNDYVDKEDAYRHSKWLSMMRHRLILARNLLKENGALICAIDENEQAHLSVVIEEIFNSFEQHAIIIVHNPKGVQGKNFSYTHEYAIFVIPKDQKIIEDRPLSESEMYISNLRNWGNESRREDAKNCFYPIVVSNGSVVRFGPVAADSHHPDRANEVVDGEIHVWPIDEQGIERKWRYARQSVDEIKDILRVKTSRDGTVQILIAKDYGTYKTVWSDKRYDASEYGTKLLREIIPGCDFDFPKSLYTVYDCLLSIVGARPDAVVLDFFAGSGTTGHAVLELNKADNGHRKFILCTNNENNICEEVTYERIKRVISGYEDKKSQLVPGLPGNLYYFKTDFVNIEKLHAISDEEKIKVTYKAGEIIAIREATLEEEEKNDWWQIFKSRDRVTAIYFKEDKTKLNELVELLEKRAWQTALYIFSWGKNEYKNEYSSELIRVEDIPEPIIEVYKEINRH